MSESKGLELTRREFLSAAGGMAAGMLAGWPGLPLSAGEPAASAEARSDFVVFSKVYQELKLDYRQSARVTAAAGLDGVDATVRPGGEVLPERVSEDLPKYVDALRERGLRMPLMATAITGLQTPHTESVLRTACRLGVRYYRLGPKHPDSEKPLADQVRELKRELKDLAAMNKEIGITGVLQNHSPSGRNTYFGGDLIQMRELLEGLDPEHLGLVFDIGHALVVHGDKWRESFEPLKANLRLVYVKDVKRPSQWQAMGEGEIHQTGFFNYLKQIHYLAPVSIHIEYPWQGGKTKEPTRLIECLKRDLDVLRGWLR